MADPDVNKDVQARELPPQKLDVIRQIGRNILLAKKQVNDDLPDDNEQLLQLRTGLDNLIAAEKLSSQLKISRFDNKAPAANPNAQQNSYENSRKAAQTRAWDMVAKLRQDAGQLHGRLQHRAKRDIFSGGLPISQQRGSLYERWANHLEAILTDNKTGHDRMAQLIDFRNRLKSKQHGILEVPLKHNTPTIQAMFRNEPQASSKQNPSPKQTQPTN